MPSRLTLLLIALLPIAACTAQDTAPAPAGTAATASAAATPTPAAGASATPAVDPAAVAAAEAALAAAQSGPPPVAGTDYVVIPDGQPFEPANGKIEVVEVFGYTCPHCATFQPLITAWKARLPADVRFTYVPAPFGGYWIPYAKAFYAAQALGVLDQSHEPMFRALHIEQALPIQSVTPEELGQWYAGHGADAAQFVDAFNSFGTEAKLNRARQFIQRSGVDGTPMLVVNGKYRIVGQSLQDTLRVANQLIAMERAAQAGAAQP
jgi:thiol:disulfide interchange protein DsbA